MTSTPGLSSATRERLEREREQLREQREALAPRLGEDPLGDSADQADLLERAENTSWLDRRIAEIDDLLTGAGQPADPGSGLRPGTRVELRFGADDIEEMLVIGIAEEAEDNLSTLTADSPLGRALAEGREGDTITYRTPSGEASAEIVRLTPPS